MDILPAIDLRDGKCVRLLQGDYERQIDYSDDPVAVARQFQQAGATWLHIVDLDAAREGTPRNLPTVEKIIAQTDLHIELGGGIRDEATIRTVLDAGAGRAIVGTAALEQWEWFESVVHKPEFERKIVLGLDARQGILAVHGWTQQTESRAVDVAERVSGWPLAAIIYTDIARDGMLLGPNLEAIRAMVSMTTIPVIASGGVTDLEDIRRLAAIPVSGVITGRALYEKQLDLAEAIAAAEA